MTRKMLHQKIKDLANEGGYDFVVIHGATLDDDVPACDIVPVCNVLYGDQRWAWVTDEVLILFASKQDELDARAFVSKIKTLRK